jgi:hypothetical protein
MMTSLTLNSLEIGVYPGHYATHRETLAMLEAGFPREPLLTEMQARTPVFNRSQPMAKAITLVVMLLAKERDDRRADFWALEAASGGGTSLVPLTLQADGVTSTWYVVCGQAVNDGWYHRATMAVVAPDPTPV